jgi:hypothetical protein
LMLGCTNRLWPTIRRRYWTRPLRRMQQVEPSARPERQQCGVPGRPPRDISVTLLRSMDVSSEQLC